MTIEQKIYISDPNCVWVGIWARNSVSQNSQEERIWRENKFPETKVSGAISDLNRGLELNRELVLTLQPVSIGIEEFSGKPNTIAAAIITHLAANPRLAIKEPAVLENLRRTLAENRDMLVEKPMAQTSIRTSPGVAYIIAGIYQ